MNSGLKLLQKMWRRCIVVLVVFAAVIMQCVNIEMLEEMLQECYDGRAAADDMARGNQTSSTKQGTDVDERLQRRQRQCSIEFTVFLLNVFILKHR
jgi:hypothetical protein